MTHFGQFTKIHKERIDDGIYPEYHDDIILNKNDKFEFHVYRKKFDQYGNDVKIDKIINKGRSVYWVPSMQH
jgi:hypothetical protein